MDARCEHQDTTTYILLEHKEWNDSEHRCKDTDNTDTATHALLAHKKWNGNEHGCKDTNTTDSNLHTVSTQGME